jgi:hypothetical protein
MQGIHLIKLFWPILGYHITPLAYFSKHVALHVIKCVTKAREKNGIKPTRECKRTTRYYYFSTPIDLLSTQSQPPSAAVDVSSSPLIYAMVQSLPLPPFPLKLSGNSHSQSYTGCVPPFSIFPFTANYYVFSPHHQVGCNCCHEYGGRRSIESAALARLGIRSDN